MKFSTIPKYCISLRRSVERRALMEGEFAKHKLKVKFFDAMDRKLVFVPELSNKNGAQHAPGIMACMMSHLMLMKRAVARGEDAIFVLEDDGKLCDDFNARIKYIEQLPDFTFDILSLGGHYPSNKEGAMEGCARGTDWNHIYETVQLNGTYAYIITKPAMEFCIRNLTYQYGMDEFMSNHLYRRFRSYAFVPFLVGCHNVKSEITGVEWRYSNIDHYFRQEAIEDLMEPFSDPVLEKERLDRIESDKKRALWLATNQ